MYSHSQVQGESEKFINQFPIHCVERGQHMLNVVDKWDLPGIIYQLPVKEIWIFWIFYLFIFITGYLLWGNRGLKLISPCIRQEEGSTRERMPIYKSANLTLIVTPHSHTLVVVEFLLHLNCMSFDLCEKTGKTYKLHVVTLRCHISQNASWCETASELTSCCSDNQKITRSAQQDKEKEKNPRKCVCWVGGGKS